MKRASWTISRTVCLGLNCKSRIASVLSNSILLDVEEVIAKAKTDALPQFEGLVKFLKGLTMLD